MTIKNVSAKNTAVQSWTKDRVERLKSLFKENKGRANLITYATSQINKSSKHKLSRNAVYKKASRIGLLRPEWARRKG